MDIITDINNCSHSMEFLKDLLLSINGQPSEFFQASLVPVDVPLTSSTSHMLKLHSNNTIERKSVNLPFTFELRPEVQFSPTERHQCAELGYLGFLVYRVRACVSKFAPFLMQSPSLKVVWSLSDVVCLVRGSGVVSAVKGMDEEYQYDGEQTSFFKSLVEVLEFYHSDCIRMMNECLHVGEDGIAGSNLIDRVVTDTELVGILHNMSLLLQPYQQLFSHIVELLEDTFPVFLRSNVLGIRLPQSKTGFLSIFGNRSTADVGSPNHGILQRWEIKVVTAQLEAWARVLRIDVTDHSTSISNKQLGWTQKWSIKECSLTRVTEAFQLHAPAMYNTPDPCFQIYNQISLHLLACYFQHCFKWIYQPKQRNNEESGKVKSRAMFSSGSEHCTIQIEHVECRKISQHTLLSMFHIPRASSIPHFQSSTDARKLVEISAFLQYMSKESNVQQLVDDIQTKAIELVQKTRPICVSGRVTSQNTNIKEFNAIFTATTQAVSSYQELLGNIYRKTVGLTWKWQYMGDALLNTLKEMHPHLFYKQFFAEIVRQQEPLLLSLDLKPAITIKRALAVQHGKVSQYVAVPQTQWTLHPSFHFSRATFTGTIPPATVQMHGYCAFLGDKSATVLPPPAGMQEDSQLRDCTQEALKQNDKNVFQLLPEMIFRVLMLHSEDGVDIPCPLLDTDVCGAVTASSGVSFLSGCRQSFELCQAAPRLQPVRQHVQRTSNRQAPPSVTLSHEQTVGLCQGYSLIFADKTAVIDSRPASYDLPRFNTSEQNALPLNPLCGLKNVFCIDVTCRPAAHPYPCFYKIYSLHVYHTLQGQQCTLAVITVISNPMNIHDEAVPYVQGSIEHNYVYYPSLPPSHAVQALSTSAAMALLLLLTPSCKSVEYSSSSSSFEVALFGNATYSPFMPDVLCGAEIAVEYIPSRSLEFSSPSSPSIITLDSCECVEQVIQLPSRVLGIPGYPAEDQVLGDFVKGVVIAVIPQSAKNTSLPSSPLFPILFPLEFIIPTVQISAPHAHYTDINNQRYDNVSALLTIYRALLQQADESTPNRLLQCLIGTFATPRLLVQGYNHKETQNIQSLSSALRSQNTSKTPTSSLLPPPLPLHGNTLFRSMEYHLSATPAALQPQFTPAITKAYSLIYKRVIHVLRVQSMSSHLKLQWNKLLLRKKHTISQHGQTVTIPLHIHRKIIQKILWIVQFSMSLKDYVDIDVCFTLYNKFIHNIANLRNNESSIYDLLMLHESYVDTVTKHLFYTDSVLSTSLSAVLDGCLSFCYDLSTNTSLVVEQFDVYHAYIDTQFQFLFKQLRLRCASGEAAAKMLEQRWNMNYFFGAE